MNSISLWSPLRDIDDIFTRFSAPAPARALQSQWQPAVDIAETDTAYLIALDIPAVPIDGVEVSVDDGVLSVSGERSVPENTADKYHRRERRFGRFSRTFRLPEHVDEDQIVATAKDGVLHLRVEKKGKEAPRRIEIQADKDLSQ